MDRAAIVERVARALNKNYDRYEFDITRFEIWRDVERILTAAGHFDLLAERDQLVQKVHQLEKVVEVARRYLEEYSTDLAEPEQALADLDAFGGGE